MGLRCDVVPINDSILRTGRSSSSIVTIPANFVSRGPSMKISSFRPNFNPKLEVSQRMV